MGRSRSLIINSQFQPFSMQEMLQPVLMADQEHKNIEEAYTQLDAQASSLQHVLDEQRDPNASKLYQNYKKNLEESVDELSERGLNTQSRRALNNVRTSFASDISRIQQAIERKGQLQEAQRQARERDDSIFFSKGAGEISIDDLMADPTISYDSVSGKSLESMAARAATSLTKEIRDRPTKWSSILGEQYYERIQKRGFRIEEVLEAVQGNPEASEVLRQIEKDVLESSNVRSWNNQEATDAALRHIRMGLWQAVGQDDIDRLQNRGYSPKGQTGDPEYPPEPSIYTEVPVTRKGKGNYDDIMEEIQDLESFRDFDFSNQEYQNYSKEREKEDNINYVNTYGKSEFILKNPFSDEAKEKEIQRVKYFNLSRNKIKSKEDLDKVIKQKYQEAANTAIRNQTYRLNFDNLQDAQNKLISTVGIQGLKQVYKYKDGKKEGKAKETDVNKVLNSKNFNIFYDPMVGVGITGIVDDKVKSYILDDESLSSQTVYDPNSGRVRNAFTVQQEAVKRALQDGNMDEAKQAIDYIMNYLAASQTNVTDVKKYTK